MPDQEEGTAPPDEKALLVRLAAQSLAVQTTRDELDAIVDARDETVRSLRAAGVSYGQLAQTMGMSRAGVVSLCNRLEAEKAGPREAR